MRIVQGSAKTDRMGFSKASRRGRSALTVGTMLSLAFGLQGCFEGGNEAPTVFEPPVVQPVALRCDETMKDNFKPDANTSVLLVKAFARGEPLTLANATTTTPVATNNLCFVKLQIGPGNPGPAGAPSTSAGIGVEVWLPDPAVWNKRYHALGGGGWAGGNHLSTTAIGEANLAPAIAGGPEASVTSTTDTGHSDGTGSFAMLPDGSINQTLWRDFSERGIHEMAVKTKALIRAYYLEIPVRSYWDGFSTGGRQGSKLAQAYPNDFDGILAGAPAFNWTKFITAELYPQIVYQRDLGGMNLTTGQANLVGNAAINACDLVGGTHLGYIPDPAQCRYDATLDSAVLCEADGGTNRTGDCLNRQQALAVNKIWFGMTSDGSVPSPAVNTGIAPTLSGVQRWYGLARGTSFGGLAGPTSEFPIASTQVALEEQNPLLAGPSFRNASGNGQNLWKGLSYAGLSRAFDRGIELQPQFSNINTDNPDLSAFNARGGKILFYHGMADVLIPYGGTINYFERVAAQMGGLANIQSFTRLYLIPGMSHGFGNGTTNPNATPPLPTRDQLYRAMVAWVENRTPPGRIEATANATSSAPAKSNPLCPYPQKPTYTGGNPLTSASYVCQ